jgi:hypothetical protein
MTGALARRPLSSGTTVSTRRRFAAHRMASLGLTAPARAQLAGDPLAVVRRLGAMQAQDLASGLWSLGIRTGGTVSDVLAAVDRREITRTWPMRGTLHWVPAADAGWMCRLLSAPAQRAATRMLAQLGLTDDLVDRAGQIWAEQLAAPGAQLSRSEASALLAEHGIDGSGQRTYHLLVRHCQRALLCQGPIRRTAAGGLEPTFVLHDVWVPAPHDPGPEQALALLAQRYIRGHAPVTERDLARWCDQPLRPVRAALADLVAAGRVRTETGPDGTAWLLPAETTLLPASAAPVEVPAGRREAPADPNEALLVPGFDEWLLGYADRSAQLRREDEPQVVPGGNGVFRGTVVAGAQVVATWRRDPTRRRGLALLVHPLAPLPARVTRALPGSAAAYGAFWEHDGEVAVRVDG